MGTRKIRNPDIYPQMTQRAQSFLTQWLLTYQDSPIVREAFSGYDIVSLERPNGIGNRGKVKSGRRYREVIIEGINTLNKRRRNRDS